MSDGFRGRSKNNQGKSGFIDKNCEKAGDKREIVEKTSV